MQVRFIGKDGDGGERFGCAGSKFGKQGTALTSNGGVTFKHMSNPDLFTYARYGAYPSNDVFCT